MVRATRRYRTFAMSLGALLLMVTASLMVTDVARSREAGPKSVAERLVFTAAARGEAPTIGLFGDSTSLLTAVGMATFDDTDTTIRVGPSAADMGCTISAPATFMVFGEPVESVDYCNDWLNRWRVVSDVGHLDAALVLFGAWEVKELKVEGSDVFRIVGDPAQDALDNKRLTEGINVLLAHTPVVVIATSPYIEPGRVAGRSPGKQQPDADRVRMDRINDLIRTVAARYPRVALLDLASWLQASVEDGRYRPDGVHFTEQTAIELAPRFARTMAAIVAVANGGQRPAADDPNLFRILKFAIADSGPQHD